MPTIRRQIAVWGLFFGNFLINTGQRAAANLAQEFILLRLMPKSKNQN
jgi:hypothetical protein